MAKTMVTAKCARMIQGRDMSIAITIEGTAVIIGEDGGGARHPRAIP